MMCKEKLETYLRDQQVSFEVQHHPTAYTAQDVAASEHIPSKLMAKVVIVYVDARMVMLVLPASHRVDLSRMRDELGVKDVWLAGEREIAVAFPDCEVGAMPPFGNLYNVPVYVDRLLAEDDTIVFQVGNHTNTISMKYADFSRLVKPTVVEFACHSNDMLTAAW
jgi:Ala-tRNA(Pro) deacylase